MTAKEVLTKHQNAYHHTFDFMVEEYVLKAMDEWARECIKQSPRFIGTLEFEKVNGSYFSCDSSQYNDLYMAKAEGRTMFAITPRAAPSFAGDTFYIEEETDIMKFLTWYISADRVFGRPNSEGAVPVQRSQKGRVRIIGLSDWIECTENSNENNGNIDERRSTSTDETKGLQSGSIL